MTKIAIFLAGTSQVGKTEYYNSVPDTVDGIPVIKQPMSVHDIRAMLLYPTWENLSTNPDIMRTQQDYILNVYEQRVVNLIEETKNKDAILMFERSPWDVVGYTYAFLRKFGYSHKELTNVYSNSKEIFRFFDSQIRKVISLSNNLVYNGFVVCHVWEDIRYDIPYDERNGTRPPVDIRMLCNQFILTDCMEYLHPHMRSDFMLETLVKPNKFE